MKFAFFEVPVGDEEAATELNSFCSTHRVAAVEKHFVNSCDGSFWAFCVSYIQASSVKSVRKPKVDYKEILSEEEFALFAKLRVLRKELADRDGVPAYAVFTNEQLAAFVQTSVVTKTAMQGISGVGGSKVTKYGQEMLAVLQAELGVR